MSKASQGISTFPRLPIAIGNYDMNSNDLRNSILYLLGHVQKPATVRYCIGTKAVRSQLVRVRKEPAFFCVVLTLGAKTKPTRKRHTGAPEW